MKFQFFIILVTGIFFTKTSVGQDTTQLNQILEATFQKLNSHKAISYEVVFTSKIYWEEDTTSQQADKVHIIREPSDNLLGGYYFLEQNEILTTHSNGDFSVTHGFKLLYDLKDTYMSLPKYLTINDAQAQGSVTQSIFANFYFIHPEMLNYLKNTPNEIKEVEQDHLSLWHLKIYPPDNPKTRDATLEFWIDKKDYTIHRVLKKFQYQNYDGFQYDDFQYNNIQYDAITKEDIFEARDSMRYQKTLLDYAQSKGENMQLLPKGTLAPSFEGWNFVESTTNHFAEFLGTPMVLVFWSPNAHKDASKDLGDMFQYFSNLNDEYLPQGLTVLSLGLPINKSMKNYLQYNDVDGLNEQNLEEYLKTQIENTVYENKLSFPTLLLEPSVGDMYNVIGFPEIYLIDKNGYIVKSYIGFTDKLQALIKDDIDKLLEE